MTTLSTAQLIEAMRTVSIAADTEQGREKLNAIANRMEMLVAANAGMDLQLNSIRAALNIPVNTSVQAGVIAETTRLNEEVLSLRSQLSESVALANKLRRTAKEHQEENQQLRTKLDAYDRAAKEPVAWTDKQELRDLEKDGCAYLFTVNPITPNADMRRVIPLFTAPPLPVVPDEKRSERFDWSFGEWAEHLGGRHQGGDPANYYEFGSFIAVAEMLKQFGMVQQKAGWNACRAAMIAAERKDGDA
ncbi:hypothetical protein LES60_06665 [Pectobacterium brasiliense]|uniref:hypothetical protein n=1 Tax=Pectobacterium brasiliense TaxID=180957 RepID=UPI001CE15568|nr:hypothetical protein [Pectobacterium brasiliense]MCA5919280.1 hypothetical protein [Pectobacterium brasiliense]MCA5926333.1 hypothetical protein [Pectobacterium brasiliense]MCA5935651.1 hypothetical protein [Pectobacterium brasiliense]MCA5941582.1 hypothetical protein [Pectobacterium brasiliense]MCA5943264.1 hypothetical protein [Pectobacterium brasiliense]